METAVGDATSEKSSSAILLSSADGMEYSVKYLLAQEEHTFSCSCVEHNLGAKGAP